MKRLALALAFLACVCFGTSRLYAETAGGWVKHPANPVLGGDLGVCFDVTLLKEGDTYKMWFSWRTKESIGYTESRDGVKWSKPRVVLAPDPDCGWQIRVNRASVLKKDGKYYMWYTGQTRDRSRIGFAVSDDGIEWKRVQSEPVLVSEEAWEKGSAMCPHVLWNDEKKVFQMWYSAGDQYEPNAIGYAESVDGIKWKKRDGNPIFAADKNSVWEQHKVTACQVFPWEGGYLMFYIGFENEHLARIGIARSQDGATDWERLPANPIIGPDAGTWDASACYKPFAMYDEQADRWLLWYNGRNGSVEQIGVVTRDGKDLGFPSGK